MKVVENRDNPEGRWMVTLISETPEEQAILERMRERRAYAASLTSHEHDPKTGKITSLQLDFIADIIIHCSQCGAGKFHPWPKE